MVQSESLCLAIEAKWTEPIYKSVSSWLHGKVKSASPARALFARAELIGYAPHGHWKTVTFVAALRDRDVFVTFRRARRQSAVHAAAAVRHLSWCFRKAREIGADEDKTAADELLGELAKRPPEPGKSSKQ
jgi:hypothetical protein